jgi:hypothetical protein
MSFVYDDGGRAAAGFKGDTRDCVARSIAIAAQLPYQEAYDLVNSLASTERGRVRNGRVKKSSARQGVFKPTIRKVMEHLGWQWVPTMTIGSGCKVHLRADELPKGRIICNVSRHSVAVVDGVIHDTHDCSRDGTRCVYGYFTAPTPKRKRGQPGQRKPRQQGAMA